MFVIKPIGNGHIFLVPTIISGLVSADVQDRAAATIKGMEHTIRTAGVLILFRKYFCNLGLL